MVHPMVAGDPALHEGPQRQAGEQHTEGHREAEGGDLPGRPLRARSERGSALVLQHGRPYITELGTVGHDPAHGQAVLTPLDGPAILGTALAPDTLHLRRLLDAAHTLA